ncbi:MAG: DUF1579 domain-containing protein [Bacteroidia bacterium]
MKKINYIICLVAFTGSILHATAQNKDAAGKDPKQDAQMKAWMTYMTPGPMHEMLAKSNGDWTEEVTMWMSPGAPPTKSTASCTNTMILGGRYQESNTKGEMSGMPFEGMSTVGYDNGRKVFVSTWIDNMGTGIMYMEGKYNEKTNTVSFSGTAWDSMAGKNSKVRETFKMVDDNNQFIEMYMTGADGKEFKTMEIKFTRKM